MKLLKLNTAIIITILLSFSACEYNAGLWEKASAEVDSLPPTISWTSPSTNDVGITTYVTVVFSEIMMGSSLTEQNIIISENSGTLVSGRLVVTTNTEGTATVVRFYPDSDYNTATSGIETFKWGTGYSIRVTTDVLDSYGNALASESNTSFTTANGLVLTSSIPADGAANIDGTATVSMTFNDPVDTTAAWSVDVGGTTYNAASPFATWTSTRTLVIDDTGVTFVPGSTVTVNNFINFQPPHAGGNPLVSGDAEFSFTIAP